MSLIWKTCFMQTSVVGECTQTWQNSGRTAVLCPPPDECVRAGKAPKHVRIFLPGALS